MGRPIVNIAEDIRKYAVEQKITEIEALEKGMVKKSEERHAVGAELLKSLKRLSLAPSATMILLLIGNKASSTELNVRT